MFPLVRGTCHCMEVEGSRDAFFALLGLSPPEEEELPLLFGRASVGNIVVTFSDTGEGRGFLLPRCNLNKVLLSIINTPSREGVGRINLLPSVILMRVPENPSQVLEQIEKDFQGLPVPFNYVTVHRKKLQGVGVAFTSARLNRAVSQDKFYSQALDISMPYGPLYNQLRGRALEYVNQGMGKRDWYELHIMIYDMWERYSLIYRRVMLTLMDLGVGLVLGEAWEKDYGRLMLPLQVYRIRLFTFFPLKRIKTILVGLEYAQDGSRLCDLDIKWGHKKGFSWTECKGEGPVDRDTFGLQCREKLFEEVDPSRRKKLLDLEKELLDQERGSSPSKE